MQQLEDGFTLRAIVFTFLSSLSNYLQCIGLNAGSELVTASFERAFENRFRQSTLPMTTTVFYKALYKARQAFNLRKMSVGNSDEDEFWFCPVDGLKRDDLHDFVENRMKFTK
jgi:hypothetical protein